MCGRTTNTLSWSDIHRLYRLTAPDDGSAAKWNPRENVAPTTRLPILRLVDGPQGKERRIDLARWGLVPAWSKEIGTFATFNARSEDIAAKPTWRTPWKKSQRCIIPVDSFFEWRKITPKEKQPYAIALGNRQAMNIAGLWDVWKNPKEDGAALLSCTIITTTANEAMKPLHDRMPVILDEDSIAPWLGEAAPDEEPCTPEQALDLLKPCAPERLTTWPVSKAVGKVDNQGPHLLEKIVL